MKVAKSNSISSSRRFSKAATTNRKGPRSPSTASSQLAPLLGLEIGIREARVVEVGERRRAERLAVAGAQTQPRGRLEGRGRAQAGGAAEGVALVAPHAGVEAEAVAREAPLEEGRAGALLFVVERRAEGARGLDLVALPVAAGGERNAGAELAPHEQARLLAARVGVARGEGVGRVGDREIGRGGRRARLDAPDLRAPVERERHGGGVRALAALGVGAPS